MHLKLTIYLNGQKSIGFWSLATLFALLASWRVLHVGATHQRPSSASDNLAAATHQRIENLIEQKCKPMLNFGLPQVQVDQEQRSAVLESRRTSNNSPYFQTAQKLSQSIPDSFSFAIGDINLPLMQTDSGTGGNKNGGAVQSAMKLLAAFDAQLYGDENEREDEVKVEEGSRSNTQEQNVVIFKQNRLFLSGLNFTMLNVHLYQFDEPRFAIGVNIANTTLVGQFQYDGYAPASLIVGDYTKMAGHYRISIDNLLLTAASNLTKMFDSDTSAKYKYNLASNEFRMNISNLGYISIEILDAKDSTKPTSNYVLKMLQRVLQKTIKRTYNKFEDYIRETLEVESRQFLDCELTRFSPLLTENLKNNTIDQLNHQPNENTGDALAANKSSMRPIKLNSTYLDDLAKIISTEIANSHLDHIALPDFEHQRNVFGSSADISFQNGSLVGLDNIKLNGETRVKLLEEHLIVNASVGWFDLRPYYNWTLYFGSSQEANSERRSSVTSTTTATNSSSTPTNQHQQPIKAQKGNTKPMAKGFVAFNIKAIDFDAVISKSVRSQSQMVVDELVIRRLDNPKMDIGGLPGMNRLTRGAVNFFMGRLKQRLVSSIQPALKHELERALNRLALFN